MSLFARYTRPHSTLSLRQLAESKCLRQVYQPLYQATLDSLDEQKVARSQIVCWE
jgi:aryl carrier-like protein